VNGEQDKNENTAVQRVGRQVIAKQMPKAEAKADSPDRRNTILTIGQNYSRQLVSMVIANVHTARRAGVTHSRGCRTFCSDEQDRRQSTATWVQIIDQISSVEQE
jgi:hypothetical protein